MNASVVSSQFEVRKKNFYDSPDTGDTPQRRLLKVWDIELNQTKGQSKIKGGTWGF